MQNDAGDGVVTRFYREKAAEGGDPDFDALDQGPERTKLRHEFVVDRVVLPGAKVLDLGCGTALVLDTMAEMDRLPGYYLGVDLNSTLVGPVSRRLDEHGVIGEFTCKPEGTRFEDMSIGSFMFDVVLCVGVVGHQGYHTYAHMRSLFHWMVTRATRGVITMQSPYGEVLGHHNQVKYDPRTCDPTRTTRSRSSTWSSCPPTRDGASSAAASRTPTRGTAECW